MRISSLRVASAAALRPPVRASKRVPPTAYAHSYSTETNGSETPLPIPGQSSDDGKSYDPKIISLVSDISKLTLLETADLNELLKSTLKIADAPVMAMGGMGAAAPKDEEEAEPKEEKTEFLVRFEKVDPSSKVKAIREVKNMMEGMTLVEAKKFVEGLPKTLKESASKEEAESMKAKLEAIGGTVVVE